MKNKICLLIAGILSLPVFTIAQEVALSKEPVVTPDKFFALMGIGLVLAFVLFVFYVLSRATIALSKTLGEKYKHSA